MPRHYQTGYRDNRSPRRLVVSRFEERKTGADGRVWVYTYEELACGHVHWVGAAGDYRPANHRACVECRDEERATGEGEREAQQAIDAEFDARYHWQASIQPLEPVPSFDDIPF